MVYIIFHGHRTAANNKQTKKKSTSSKVESVSISHERGVWYSDPFLVYKYKMTL